MKLNIQCYINCLLETLNIIDENGNIDANNAVQQLNLMRGNQEMNSTQSIVNYCIKEIGKMMFQQPVIIVSFALKKKPFQMKFPNVKNLMALQGV